MSYFSTVSVSGICLILGLWAQTLFAQTQPRVTLQLQDKTPLEVLQTLEADYGLRFFFKPASLPTYAQAWRFNQETVGQVLERLLIGTPLGFTSYQDAWIIVDKAKLQAALPSISQEQAGSPAYAPPQAIILGDPEKAIPNTNVKLSGKILNQLENTPLISAKVLVEKLKLGTLSDEEGKYQLSLPVGAHQLSIQATGFAEIWEDIEIYEDAEWDIQLDLQDYRLDEVLLEAEASDQNVSSAQVGTVRLSIRQIKNIPVFLGEVDVIKSILLVPGVSSIGEGASGFNVRGGSIDQNLILQDGAPIFNSSHVLGFFSIFNPDVVSGLTLYKGHTPAQFGGRLSSVLDVNLKDGNYDKLHFQGGLGIVSSRFTLDGPIQKGKSSFLLGARSSYSDWALRITEDPDLDQSSAFFYDLNAKLSQRIGDKHTISLSAYRSFDRFRYSDQFGYTWGTQIFSGNYRYIADKRFSTQTTLAYGDYESSFFEPEGTGAFELENGLEYQIAKQQAIWAPNDQHVIHVGGEWTQYQMKPERVAPSGSESIVAERAIEKDRAREFALFINDEFSLGNFISLSVGLRYSWFQYLGADSIQVYAEGMPRTELNVVDTVSFGKGSVISQYQGWEPRASMRLRVDENSSFKMSYNRMRQYVHLISNSAAATPLDVWQVSNRYLEPQLSHNYSFGYFRNFSFNAWESSVELFYKDIDQLLEFRDWAALIMNRHVETELLQGEGRAYGVEFSLKKNTGRWTGWLGYTYSRSERRVAGNSLAESINGGEWYPAPFDRPHQFNFTSTFKLNRQNSFSFNFTYHSGRPITAPISGYTVGTTTIPNYSDRNQVRIPAYHRLDVSYTWSPSAIKRKKFKGDFVFSVYNLYARKNAFSVFFQRRDSFIPEAFRLAVLGTLFPSLSYNFKF